MVHWSEPFYGANRGGPYSVPAVPRHIMQEPYLQGDKQAFSNSLYWTTQFVGLGPYRLGDWVQGSFAEALAFDDYFLGQRSRALSRTSPVAAGAPIRTSPWSE